MSDVKEMQVREHANKIEELEDTILDLDGTIGQFRELVTQLQK
jgi:dynactin 1